MPVDVENLPAPTQPSDLDGWTSDDLEGWLGGAARKVAEAEAGLDDMRIAVGMVLYRLRVELGDGRYGEAVVRVARESGVSAASLSRWRTKAEERFQLPPPSVRTVARRERVEREQLTSSRDVSPPKAIERGAEPAADPGPDARERASTPALAQPTKREDYRRLIGLIVTAGPETLATSVERAELAKALGVLRAAVGAVDKTERVDLRPGAPVCECEKPTLSKVAPICTTCGRRR